MVVAMLAGFGGLGAVGAAIGGAARGVTRSFRFRTAFLAA
jgi:hypothetical protein